MLDSALWAAGGGLLGLAAGALVTAALLIVLRPSPLIVEARLLGRLRTPAALRDDQAFFRCGPPPTGMSHPWRLPLPSPCPSTDSRSSRQPERNSGAHLH